MSKSNSLPWSQFRTRTPHASRIFLDVGRAEVMFATICLPDLLSHSRLAQFINAAQIASGGTAATLELLIDAFNSWHQMDEALEANIRRLWSKGTSRASVDDAIATLRHCCTEQQTPLPATLIEALFDDASFDFVAYLAWHNNEDPCSSDCMDGDLPNEPERS